MIVVFLGPSLAWSEARALVRADFRAPARQGDVFRAIDDGATAIVLIDGVFEASPSVWHHELIAASACGLRVFGASSMGALRAAELPEVVEPLGTIAHQFVSGAWNDDAYVALLHGDRESGFRGLTVPWVNVWATADAAMRAKVIDARQAREVCAAAESIFYQSRSWPSVLAALRWSQKRREALGEFVTAHAVDLKASDARLALQHVETLRAQKRLKLDAPRATAFSSFVRRQRLAHRTPQATSDEGVRVLLRAELARLSGVMPARARVAFWRRRLAREPARDVREAWAESLALSDAAGDVIERFSERAGVEDSSVVLSAAERFVCDGPSAIEGAALVTALE